MSIFPTSIKLLMCSLFLLLNSCGGNDSVDTVAPVITLNGDSTVTLFVDDSYSEAGASATDAVDGAVNVVMTGSVDTSTAGSYTLNYSATDHAGNTSSVTRTVNVASRPFITTWQTDAAFGASDDNQIMIGTLGTGYDYGVDWGDGNVDENVTGDIVHTYDAAGTYTVSISGDFPHLYFAEQVPQKGGTQFYSDHRKLRSVEQWGDIQWRSMHRAFAGSRNLEINATDDPDLSSVNDMSYMFSDAGNFNQDLSSWDVSNVTDMSYMFSGAGIFNQDLSRWEVSNVTDMRYMFEGASAFNEDISSWNVSNVTNMRRMFLDASSFNQELGSWDVSHVTDMEFMFSDADAFNQDLSNWDLSHVITIRGMFQSADVFNQDLSAWDVSNVTDMYRIFADAVSFNGELSAWDVSNVRSMLAMFFGASAFNQDLSGWDVSNVIDMRSMFAEARNFNRDISSWNVSKVRDMSSMFSRAAVFNQDLNSWDVSNVINMNYMFAVASAFNQDLSSWDVSNVTDMSKIFSGATLSTENYDALLLSWSRLSLQENVTFDGGNSHYSNSSQSARDILTDVYGWTVTDGGTDTTGPVITLVGDSTITLFVGDGYEELGASAFDVSDGDVDVVISGTVDTRTEGSYTLIYSATDTAGNTSSVTRTINVILFSDTIAPVITLNGDSTITLFVGDSYEELGVDIWDDDVYEVWIDGAVDNNRLGSYYILYIATDYSGNETILGRNVHVILPPIVWPVITLNGANAVVLSVGESYEELGASATDNDGDEVEVVISGEVDTSIIGIYTVNYSATDSANNTNRVTRMVNVIDVGGSRSFITTWQTDVRGVSARNQIRIGTQGDGYDYRIDWGDGHVDENVTGDIIHTYDVRGTYAVSISGDFPQLYFAGQSLNEFSSVENFFSDHRKLRTIEQWGENQWRSMHRAFANCSNVEINATDVPDLSGVSDMSYMFYDESFLYSEGDFFNQDLSGWDVSNVTDMSYMFWGARSFNQDLSGWDVSNVAWMTAMFNGVTLSTENYDALLLGWSRLLLQENVTFDGGNNQYSSSSQNARDILTDVYGWTITDGGVDD